MAEVHDREIESNAEQAHPTSSVLFRYGGAIALAVVAIAVRMVVASWHSPVHLIFYYAAVAASAWLFDFGPAVVTLGICFALAALDVGSLRDLRIEEAVSNLLTNAIKFTPDSGVIEVALSDRGATAQLTVIDSGAGIDPDSLPRVFERFAQDQQSLRINPGLGLGLFIVKHVVELHEGAITAASAGVGKGATFTVTLPTGSAAQRTPIEDAS